MYIHKKTIFKKTKDGFLLQTYNSSEKLQAFV